MISASKKNKAGRDRVSVCVGGRVGGRVCINIFRKGSHLTKVTLE